MFKIIILISVLVFSDVYPTTMTTGDLKEDYEIVQIVYGYSKSSIRGYGIRDSLSIIEREAENLGADAVIEIRIEITPGVSEEGKGDILIYGTAVKLKRGNINTPEQENNGK
jgi:hypothetical protein